MKMIKKITRWLINNYFLSIFFASIAFVGVVSVYKLFFVKPTYIYVKVKVGQGLWWASTQKPSLWFVQSFEKLKKDQEKDLTGQPVAQVLSVRYYPTYIPNQYTYIPNQYDVYLTMKLKVTKMGKVGKYNFKRSAIGVGSPVDFEFPSAQFSGTIIALSENPFKEKYIEKIVYITKLAAYSFEYDSIQLNDRYFDGEDWVVEVLDKEGGEIANLIPVARSLINPNLTQTRQNIVVKLRLKGKVDNNNFIFGEEQIIAPGKTINLSTNNFQFNDYVIAKVE